MNKDIDLDALLAIVRKRTPGELRETKDGFIIDATGCIVCSISSRPNERSAICTAVNNFEAVVERCKESDAMSRRFAKQTIELDERCKRAENRIAELNEYLGD